MSALAWISSVALAAALACAAPRDPPAEPRLEPARPGLPNFVVVLVDDLGWGDLGCYGNGVHETPRIDALAAAGLRFTQAYAAGPNCTPSRAALLSGEYAPRTGVYTVGRSTRGKERDRKLVPEKNRTDLGSEVVCLPEVLAPAGYACAAIGKWHIGDDPRRQGFQVAIGGGNGTDSHFSPYPSSGVKRGRKGEYLADRLTSEAIRFIEQQKGRPFFLYLAHFAVHTPIEGKPELVRANEERGAKHPTYAAMVASVDESVGRLTATLERLGLSENTVVIVTSDNGGHVPYSSSPLRGSKGMLYEGGLRVPLIVSWPRRIRSGVSHVPAHGVDLFPTLLELARLPAPPGKFLDGVSLARLWLAGEEPARAALYWHFPAYLQSYTAEQGTWRTTPAGAMRKGDHKLVEFFEDGRLEVYDLARDPGEAHDLASMDPVLTQRLHAELLAWRAAIGATVPTQRNPRWRAR